MAPPRQVTAALLIRLIKICKVEELGGRPMLRDRSGNWSSTTPFVGPITFESAFKISSLLNTALNGKQKCHPNKRLQKASSWSISSQQKYDRVKKKITSQKSRQVKHLSYTRVKEGLNPVEMSS